MLQSTINVELEVRQPTCILTANDITPLKLNNRVQAIKVFM